MFHRLVHSGYSLHGDTFPLSHHCILYPPPPPRFSGETSDWEVRGGGQETQKQHPPVDPTPQHERNGQKPCRLKGLSSSATSEAGLGQEAWASLLPKPRRMQDNCECRAAHWDVTPGLRASRKARGNFPGPGYREERKGRKRDWLWRWPSPLG